MKTLMSSEKLLEHMERRGIKFNIVSRDEAKEYLTYNTYYKKISSYKKNYVQTKVNGEKQYQNLEFAYLQELSKIDMYVRQFVLLMCLDIEHAMKVELMRCASENLNEDGFNIVQKFLARYPDVIDKVHIHATNTFCHDLIVKNERKMSLCVLLEVISFGDLCKLYNFYESTYPRSLRYKDIPFLIRELRNAAAHNNCLLNDLTKGNAHPRPAISKFVSAIEAITSNQQKIRLSNHFINDFVSMLFFFSYIVKSEGIKKVRYEELKKLFNERMVRNKEYFCKNIPITQGYDFLKKVVSSVFENVPKNLKH